MSFAVASYMLGRSSIDLRSYTIGTLASLPTLCGYVFIGKTTRRAAFLAEMVPWSALCGHQALALAGASLFPHHQVIGIAA